VRGKSRGEFRLSFYAGDPTAFASDNAYEHDFQLHTDENCTVKPGTFPPQQVEPPFWVKRHIKSMRTNLKWAYIDTPAFDDVCHWRDLTIGTYYPRLMVNGKYYYISFWAPRDTAPSSPYQLSAQQYSRHCASGAWCVSGLQASLLLVGYQKGMVPGCRSWRRGEPSAAC
jgi:hypothetical protein